jgi:hypothetical protein
MVEGAPISGGGGEILVILDRESAAEALASLSTRFRVTHAVSPRVVVIETDPGQPPPSTSQTGVVAVSDGPLNPEIVETLDYAEGLFVSAWTRRMIDASKQRRGEGLSWDAEGFTPPDPPAGRPSAGLSP